MSESNPILQDTIRLDVEVPQQVKGLSDLLTQLEQVKRAALAVDAALKRRRRQAGAERRGDWWPRSRNSRKAQRQAAGPELEGVEPSF